MKHVSRKIGILFLIIVTLLAITYTMHADASNGNIGKYSITANSGLRLRESAINGNTLIVMPKGSSINITGWDGEWAFGYYQSYLGWCHSKYLNYISESNSNINLDSINLEYFATMKITGYTPSPSENGGWDVTCTGIKLKTVIGECVAVNKYQIPIGTRLYIEGIGYRTAMDTGVRSGVIDVLCSTTSECYAITGNRKVYIVK